ncbi:MULTISPECIES: tetratricopeptide repeat protein [unclassified Undibacterium]|uniref:tetratricopeptide repeat protein n=1 Tax=unclassified Undibacterium TaxID=2630295 RepID=UPI002AC9C37B|nr:MULTISPECIES: tetratricopeptide repeat protein [unclassified Undibacterium]MEB0140339.1 tetratricopeptide repeat protein [Undibacterium sp. CCC2.1]MEB0172338.1 tetratricopeptide repeat protein [Undibacterium sp. CCC1.1]MEB0176254.1 tetratricopeptide repeat protein [Undibacterium sp. CCC3.4]MEB0215506.1 tetratricopeptide repeat protein [Undibacterium sp. 5I2]WPX44348.1 tetratricopeptide repeat protein [Undibacterium sp. CCC3.4]
MKTLSAFVSTSIVAALRPAATLSCVALLSACAGFGGHGGTQTEQAHHAEAAAQSALAADKDLNGTATAAAENQEGLPKVALSDELLYKILTAEIAYQRGSWQAAYVTLMGAAQQTRDPRLARRSAEIALSVKQAGEALAAIRLWRELAPESNEAAQYYLGFMVMNNNLSEIRSVFSERLKNADAAQYPVIMLQAQRLLARARDKNAAFDMLEETLAPYKAIPEAHLALAQGAYNKGDSQRAISEASAMLAARPDSQLAILTIAQASPQPQAATALAAFLKKNPGARDVRLAYASILIDLKQLDLAAAEFEWLLHEKADDLNAIYTLGMLALEKNQFSNAETYFLRFLKTVERTSEDRDVSNALINLARIAIERKDYAAAQDWLSKVDAFEGRNPVWFNVQLRRANLLAKDGKLDSALALLKDLKTTTPEEQIQARQTEAQLLRDGGRTVTAATVLQAAIKAHPENPDLMYDFAMLLESQQEYAQMEQLLRRVIAVAPTSQHAYNALGYSYADRNIQLTEALNLIQKANQLAADDPFILDSLGWAYFRLNLLDDAAKTLQRAYTLRPDADIAAHLGEVLLSLGKKDEALTIWRAARAKAPDNAALNSTLKRLNIHD